MLESVSTETNVGCENAVRQQLRCMNATLYVVCSCHVLMCGAQVLMGWPGQQLAYSIIAPCQQRNETN